jgi:hypothetical protein
VNLLITEKATIAYWCFMVSEVVITERDGKEEGGKCSGGIRNVECEVRSLFCKLRFRNTSALLYLVSR